jgi:hypothetical protein
MVLWNKSGTQTFYPGQNFHCIVVQLGYNKFCYSLKFFKLLWNLSGTNTVVTHNKIWHSTMKQIGHNAFATNNKVCHNTMEQIRHTNFCHDTLIQIWFNTFVSHNKIWHITTEQIGHKNISTIKVWHSTMKQIGHNNFCFPRQSKFAMILWSESGTIFFATILFYNTFISHDNQSFATIGHKMFCHNTILQYFYFPQQIKIYSVLWNKLDTKTFYTH